MLTQDDYKLYTGETTNFSNEDWLKLTSLSSQRLLSLLCLEELPKDSKGNTPDDFQLVWANFIYLMLAHRGQDSRVTHKSVRNFSISYGSSSVSGAFAKLTDNYGDILEQYSNCKSSFSIEHNTRICCERL